MSLIEKHGSDHQKRVAQFMRGARQSVPDTLVVPDVETRRLRAKLRLEEALEEIDALGFDVFVSDKVYDRQVHKGSVWFWDARPCDPIGVIDGVCDNSVIGAGTLTAFGLPDTPFIEEVDANNLAKLGPGHSIREDGKLLKPVSHCGPRLDLILERLLKGGG